MTVALSVVALGVLGVAVVAFAVRKKPAETRTGPGEGDTAWNDPIEGVNPAARADAADGYADTPSTNAEPRP